MKLNDDNLNAALATLLPRERRLIELRNAGATFRAIGVEFDRTPQLAFVEHSAALRKLKARLKAKARLKD